MYLNKKHRTSQGFTLIELSIVLVIIGMVVGGILVGKNLIRNAQLNSIPADIQRFKSANAMFIEKYQSRPGDMVNASTTWGLDAGCAARTTLTGKATCNGNGDGMINFVGNNAERFYFWHHLYISGILTDLKLTDYGNSSEVHGGTGYSVLKAGFNIPEGKMEGSSYHATVQSQSTVATWGTVWFAPGIFNKNMFVFGGGGSINSINAVRILTPAEAASIDKKMDDGFIGAGKVVGSALDTLCGLNTAGQIYGGTTATYNVSYDGPRCYMGFLMDEEQN